MGRIEESHGAAFYREENERNAQGGYEKRVRLIESLQADSRIYARHTPEYWKRVIDITYTLEAFKAASLETDEISPKNVQKMNGLLTMLTFGLGQTPWLLVLEADEHRTAIETASLVMDRHYDEQGQPTHVESLESPALIHLSSTQAPQNVVHMMSIVHSILDRRMTRVTLDGGIRTDYATNSNGCFPHIVAFGGTHTGELAAGRLLRGEYKSVLSTRR